MIDRVRDWSGAHLRAWWAYPAIALLTAVLFCATHAGGGGFIWLYLGAFALILFALRPGSRLHTATVAPGTPVKAVFAVLTAAVTAIVCIAPMGELPIWNGEYPAHRNQYELMAEAILNGRIEIVYDEEDELARLKNPYDPEERSEAGVRYHWDHAYYKGHYYMYFGVVPVLLIFLPYRAVTGEALTTYHATQLFTVLFIAGIFALFYLLAGLFFKKLPFSVYLGLSAAFSAMSVWYAAAEPALYCTAITGALALEIWSLWFFVRAVWGERRENRQIALAAVGAALGALAFGCRPSIALANVLVIPMLIVFLRQRKITWGLLGRLALAALPYVIVAAGLMWYNYARFENPFEFGQAYQLTTADQSGYRISLDLPTVLRVLNGTLDNLFRVGKVSAVFPYLRTSSVFFNFPILLLCVGMFIPAAAAEMRRVGLLPLTIGLFAGVFLITAVDIMWTPYLLERYRMDIYFLMGIACFIAVGLWHGSCAEKGRARLSFVATAMALATVISSYLLYVYTVGVYYPDEVAAIGKALRLL